MLRLSGAELTIRLLENQGVTHIAGIPGGFNLPLYDALGRRGTIRHILARHEQGAGFIAQGMARVTGRPGVIRRRPSLIQSSSIKRSMVPRLTATPRISSISVRVTGW